MVRRLAPKGTAMNQVAAPRTAGTAQLQGELWGVRAGDWAELQEGVFRPLYDHVLRHPDLAHATSSLDVGCGAGLAAQMFAGKIAAVAGLDACGELVEIARRRVPGGDFRVGEMEALPYADESFDVVTGFNAFQYAASPVNALREARRVTKPGRPVVIATWGMYEDCEASGHLKALAALMPPPPAGTPGPFALSDEARAKALVREAGLTPVAMADVDCSWVYPSLDVALRAMLSAGPAEKAIRAAGPDRARDAVASAIAPFRTASGGYHMKNRFRYLIARA
jgi:SAM-dependent methyltransferase